MAFLTLYHGSSKVVRAPQWGMGNPHNDYGLGFYCTESIELAKEWGASEQADGFANCYELETDDLKTLNLNSGDFTILHWLAVLLQNRTFRTSGDFAPLARSYIVETFPIDYQNADIIRGYRADDSYFSFANAFINNALSLARLEQAMMLGDLGEQVVVKSKKAFKALHFKGAEPAEASVYYPRKLARDTKARAVYRQELKLADLADEASILTIMREGWGPSDARLRRIVS